MMLSGFGAIELWSTCVTVPAHEESVLFSVRCLCHTRKYSGPQVKCFVQHALCDGSSLCIGLTYNSMLRTLTRL